MSFRAKVRALGLAAAALSLSLLLGAFFSYRGTERRARRPLSSLLNTGTIAEITLRGQAGTVVLKRGGAPSGGAKAGWNIELEGELFPADAAKVERLFEIMDGATLSPPLTENPENWARFELGDETRRRLTLSGPRGAATILIGKEGEAGRGGHIRFEGGNAVYLLSQSLAYYSERDSAYWSDLRLLPKGMTGRDITAIAASGKLTPPEGGADFGYTIFRETRPEGQRWVFAPGVDGEPDQAAADTLASALAGLAAKAFAPGLDPAQAGLQPPAARVTLNAANQTVYEILIGAEAPGGRYCALTVKGGPLSRVYIIDAYSIERITRGVN
jgi:hypothetical protein